jgi:hypothetical protein
MKDMSPGIEISLSDIGARLDRFIEERKGRLVNPAGRVIELRRLQEYPEPYDDQHRETALFLPDTRALELQAPYPTPPANRGAKAYQAAAAATARTQAKGMTISIYA